MKRVGVLLALLALPLGAQVYYTRKAGINLPAAPSCMGYDAPRERLIVAGNGSGKEYLAAVRPSDRTVTPLRGTGSFSISAIHATSAELYLAERQAGALTSLEPDGTPRQKHSVGHFPGSAILLPDTSAALVLTGTDWHPGNYDSGSALRMIPLPLSGQKQDRVCVLPEALYGEVRSLCLSRDGRRVYVAASPSDYGAATLISIDLPSLRVLASRTLTGDGIWVSRRALTLSSDDAPVMAVDGRQGSYLAIFTRDLQLTRSIALEPGPTQVATAPDRSHAVVASRGGNCLRSLDLQTLTLSEAFESPAAGPGLLCFDASGEHLFVGSSYEPRVAMLERTATHPGRSPREPPPPLEERIVYSITKNARTAVLAVKPDGSDPRVIFELPEEGGRIMNISPDGTRLSYHKTVDQIADIFVYTIRTGETIRLTHLLRDEGVASRGTSCSYWLPHGRALVYEAGYSMYETKIRIVSADGGPSGVLLDTYGDRDMVPMPHPWDPDRVLFLFDTGNWTFNRQLRLFDRETGSQWTILPDDGHADDSPVWHPDGKRIFWTQSGTTLHSPATVWSMYTDGTERTQVMPYPKGRSATNRVAAVSPDRTRLLYTASTQEDKDVYLWDLKTGEASALAATDMPEQAIGWCLMALPP